MGEAKAWNWQVSFQARGSAAAMAASGEGDEEGGAPFTAMHVALAGRRLSLPADVGRTPSPFEEQQRLAIMVSKLKQALQVARQEFLELRQEASDLQEYSSAKLGRVTRYLGVLSEKTRKLDQVSLEYEARLAVLRKEKSLHFNQLLSAKGKVRVFIRPRPIHDHEVMFAMSFPYDATLQINDPRKGNVEFRFDKVYKPRDSQGDIFQDIQPFVQSAFDGYNVSIFVCGPKGSGKTYTLEGPSHDRGVYFRTFEELFDLANAECTVASKFLFYVTMLEVCDDGVHDLLKDIPMDFEKPSGMTEMESTGPLVQHQLENPRDFARLFKAGLHRLHPQHLRRSTVSENSSPCIIVTFHVNYSNSLTGDKQYSKISLVDVPGREAINFEGMSKSFTSLVQVLSTVASKKDSVQIGDSRIARILSDSLGGDSKTLMLLTLNPGDSAIDEAKSWLKSVKFCNDMSRTLQDKIFKEQNDELKSEVEKLRAALQESKHNCSVLSAELQNTEKDPSTSSDRRKFEREIAQLKTQVAQYARSDREQKAELADRASKILALEDRIRELTHGKFEEGSTLSKAPSGHRVEEELSKRDELIERLHEENERLFQRLTVSSPKMRAADHKINESSGPQRKAILNKAMTPQRRADSASSKALQTTGSHISKTTPAGEYLTNALTEFDPDQYNGAAAISDAANKLLMLVLAAVIKAGASKEHDMLEEIRPAVFAFIRKLEPRKLMDAMLVSRVRILYVRSLLAKSPELQSFKVPSLERFLEKAGGKSSRSGSSGSSPSTSPVSSQHFSNARKDLIAGDFFPRLKVNLKQEKTSKLSSIVLRLRGIDQETWRQHVTGTKLKEVNQDAWNYAVGNKRLAALFVHVPAGELQRQIRTWLAENFDFLSLTSGENVSGTMGQLELLATAIMDGWMAGLGIPVHRSTDSLGQLLSDYTKHVYMSQLQQLKDLAGTLATEEVEDLQHLAKLRSSLEAIDAKRRKVLQSMKNDPALLTKQEGGSPLRCPSTASEEARVASLISLEDIANQAEEIREEAPYKATFPAKRRFMLSRLSSLTDQVSTLLTIDHNCAHKFIREARKAVELVPEQQQQQQQQQASQLRRRGASEDGELSSSSEEWMDPNHQQGRGNRSDVTQWSVLQFNNGSQAPFIVKCGANSAMQLVIRAAAGTAGAGSVENEEVTAVVPSPSALVGLSLEEIREALRCLPEAFRQLAMARTADGTRARYSRLYKTLAVRVPSLRMLNSSGSMSDQEQRLQQQQHQQSSKAHSRRASDQLLFQA